MKKLLPLRKNNQFYHPEDFSILEPESFVFGTIPAFTKSYIKRWFSKKHDASLWVHDYFPQPISVDPVITWIGHATFLIQINGKAILTDPLFGNIPPFFRRLLPPGITLAQLPKIDYVLLSHNHRDHMDAASLIALKKMNPDLIFLVPYGDKAWFDNRGISGAQEFIWWDEHVIPEIRLVFLPAVHWSQRGLFDKNKSLWGSWMIEGSAGGRIYFAGDTAYSVHFDHIARNFAKIDTVLMPIGPCQPDAWMRRTHVSPQQAVDAFADLKATHFIPMHWGTFALGSDHFDMPLEHLKMAWHEKNSIDTQLHIVKVGQSCAIRQSVPSIVLPDKTEVFLQE